MGSIPSVCYPSDAQVRDHFSWISSNLLNGIESSCPLPCDPFTADSINLDEEPSEKNSCSAVFNATKGSSNKNNHPLVFQKPARDVRVIINSLVDYNFVGSGEMIRFLIKAAFSMWATQLLDDSGSDNYSSCCSDEHCQECYALNHDNEKILDHSVDDEDSDHDAKSNFQSELQGELTEEERLKRFECLARELDEYYSESCELTEEEQHYCRRLEEHCKEQ